MIFGVLHYKSKNWVKNFFPILVTQKYVKSAYAYTHTIVILPCVKG